MKHRTTRSRFLGWTPAASALLVGALLISSCQKNAVLSSGGDEPRELTAAEKQLVTTGNNFGLGLFQSLSAAEPDSNIFISPLSVSLALGMALNGASGETYEEMRNTLAFQGLSEEQINQSYRDLVDLLLKLDPKVVLEIANSMWVEHEFHPLPAFLQANQTYFDALTEVRDFSDPGTLPAINSWIEGKTHGRVENALDRIDPLAVLYLINVLYFKGTWTYQFEEDETVDAFFSNGDGSQSPCRMMRQAAALPLLETDSFQAVDLPYGDGSYSMTILLPKGDVTLESLISQITPETWAQWMGGFRETEILLHLPRFKLEYGALLNDVLISMGMPDAFSSGADFTRIDPLGGIWISRVIHKAFVEVNEQGTEAAGTTIVEFIREGSPYAVILDRPFLFAIRESRTGTLLFIGKMVDFPGA